MMTTATTPSHAVTPPVSAFTATPMSLFQAFLCNTEDERDRLSNTIELWDSIPKYATTQQAMNQARTPEGFLPRLEKPFIYKKREYRVRISPAIIDAEGGGDQAFYPSGNEEIIEDALRKIAAEQMAVIAWHRRETRRPAENTNFSLTVGKNPAYSPTTFFHL